MNDSSPKGTALVTGASDRIGAVLATRLAAAGWAVIIHYHASSDAAQALAEKIARSGGRAAAIGADLTDRKQRSGLIAAAAQVFGPLAVLINNASIYEPDSVETLDEALWDQHFALHAEAPLFLTRDFAAQLPNAATGNVINIIDARVLDLTPAYTSYTLSKSALWAATRTMAQSLAPRIRVNAIGPGPTLPEAGQAPAEFAARVAGLPLRLGANPDDITDAVLYLLGAKSVTGQMLALDGGSHLAWPQRADPTSRLE